MKRKKIITILSVIIVLSSLTAAIYFYKQYQRSQRMLNNPEEAAQLEAQKLVGKLNKFMDLPADEIPNVATVLDKEKLKDQPFFAKAENGDKVLIYTKSAKAILYRESTNRLIDMAPITMNAPQATPTPTPTASVKK